MEQKVEVSRNALMGLVLALMISLVAVAFLLGRESAQPQVATSPRVAVPVLAAGDPAVAVAETTPMATLASSGIPTRRESRVVLRRPADDRAAAQPAQQHQTEPPIAAAPDRQGQSYPQASSGGNRVSATVNSGRAAVSSQTAPKVSKADSDAIRRYLSQVDGVMASTQSLDDLSGFATQLLQQSMAGDTSGFDQLLSTSESALRDLKAIKPPARAKEHHQLMMSQLQDGIGLLRKVKSATTSMDSSGLASLSLQGKSLQADTARLQELDRELRGSL